MEAVDGGEPVRRGFVVAAIVAVVAVADDRRAGIALVRHAVVHAGEDCRDGEIGVGVGTARAVLDVAARRRTRGDAERYGAVVDAPEIGRAHVRTPVTNAHLVCRLLLEKKKSRQYL